MYKSLFTTEQDQDTEEFEGYTDGTSVFFTREQATEFLDAMPYDYRFIESNTPLNPRPYPVLIIYSAIQETIESTPIPTDDGEILEGYCLEGYCFTKVSPE